MSANQIFIIIVSVFVEFAGVETYKDIQRRYKEDCFLFWLKSVWRLFAIAIIFENIYYVGKINTIKNIHFNQLKQKYNTAIISKKPIENAIVKHDTILGTYYIKDTLKTGGKDELK